MFPFNFDVAFIQQGWQCPKCERIYAPSIMECPRCNQSRYTYTYTPLDMDNSDTGNWQYTIRILEQDDGD